MHCTVPAWDSAFGVVQTLCPGSLLTWLKVEVLASAFSSLPVFARLPWPARLKLFASLEYQALPAGKELQVARLETRPVSHGL